MKTYILHHNDLDGYVSADILKTKYPEAICYECSYDNKEQNPKMNNFSLGDNVFMVDFSMEPEMMKWFDMFTNFVWIDHHISAINKSKKEDFDKINGLRENGLSGAELTLKYLYPKMKNRFIELVGEFDTFRVSNDREYFHNIVMPFFYGTQFYIDKIKPSQFDSEDFLFKSIEDFNETNIEMMMKIGEIIYKYNQMTFKDDCIVNAYVRNIWGVRVLCINNLDKGSMIFDIPKYFDKNKHDMMCVYHYNGNKWCYGFYAPNGQTKVDCSKIAMNYGGGGHVCASGACSDELIEELK